MADFRALSMGAKAAILVGGVAVVSLAGYGGWVMRKAPPVDVVESAQDVAAEPAIAASETAAPVADVAATSAPAATPAPAAPIAPSFDVVRVEPDGSTVVAGIAQPGSKIILRIDGVEISATTADDIGNFVGLFVLGSSAAPRMLTMTSILPDQTEIAAAAEVALAPTEAPLDVAAVEPEPAVQETVMAAVPDPAAVVAAPAAPATAPAPPAALLITKDGVKILQSGDQTTAAGPVGNLTIDTISYSPTGDVHISGRAASGAVIRIYLDNAPLIDVKADENGLWASTMPPIAPGIYTLRADQLAADGTVTARFETPFKRETQDTLAAATQTPDPAVEVAVAAPAPATVAAASVPAPVAIPAAISAAIPLADASATENPQDEATADAEPAPVAVATVAPEPASAVSITVQPGFTLWGIASKQFGDGVMYVQVYQANKDKIRDPNLIYPGQVFVIPTASE